MTASAGHSVRPDRAGWPARRLAELREPLTGLVRGTEAGLARPVRCATGGPSADVATNRLVQALTELSASPGGGPELLYWMALTECLADADRPEQAAAVLARHAETAARGSALEAGLLRAAYQVAAAARLHDRTASRLATRRSFGQPMIEHQALRFRLAEMSAHIDGTRSLVYAAAGLQRGGPPLPQGPGPDGPAPDLVAAACLQAARLWRQIAWDSLHLHGAAGQLADDVPHRFVQGAQPGPPGQGTEALLAVIANAPEVSRTGRVRARLDPDPAPVSAYRQRVRRLVQQHPGEFGPAAWQAHGMGARGTSAPDLKAPGRRAVALLGEHGLLAPAGLAPGRSVGEPSAPSAVAYSAALQETLAPLPAGAAVLTHVEVTARLLASFTGTQRAACGAAEGRFLAALAVTEPGGGLDSSALTTTVRPHGTGLVLDGEKWFASNSPFADELLVLARDVELGSTALGGHTLLRVPVRTPGVSVRPLSTLGHRGLTGHIQLHRVRVGRTAVLGAPGTGLISVMRHWTHERVMLAVRMAAMAEWLLGLMGSALRTAPQAAGYPGQPCAARRCAELFAAVAQEQAACGRALGLLEQAACPPDVAAGCKLRASAVLREVAEAASGLDAALTEAVRGFPGISPDEPGAAARVWRDATGLALAGGSDEALLMVIARGMG